MLFNPKIRNLNKHLPAGLWNESQRIFNFSFITANYKIASAQNPPLAKAQQIAGSKRSPVYFIENKGQVHDGNYNPRSDVLFMGITPAQQYVITAKGTSHQLKKLHWKESEKEDDLAFFPGKFPQEKEVEKTEFYRVDMEWIGANENPHTETQRPLTGYINYYNVTYAEDGILEVREYEV